MEASARPRPARGHGAMARGLRKPSHIIPFMNIARYMVFLALGLLLGMLLSSLVQWLTG